MKSHLLSATSLATLISLNINTQSERTPLFECFTNTGGTTCIPQQFPIDLSPSCHGNYAIQTGERTQL